MQYSNPNAVYYPGPGAGAPTGHYGAGTVAGAAGAGLLGGVVLGAVLDHELELILLHLGPMWYQLIPKVHVVHVAVPVPGVESEQSGV
jgi:hypothetical protein